jgi:hypothetical protein
MECFDLNSGTQDYVQPTRTFSVYYIILDSLFIVGFLILLFVQKKRVTALWAIAGGLLYWIVDFGFFYGVSGSRAIYSYLAGNEMELADPAKTGLVLFWMSMSYGITDFAFIWLWLSKDRKALEYSLMIVVWWICCPLMAQFLNQFGSNTLYFQTTRSTSKYHGIMGLIMAVGYFIVILLNLFRKDPQKKIPLIRLFVVGFLAQFLWEFILLLMGIRSSYDEDFPREMRTLFEDSLVETNLGMPYIYFIHKAVTSHFNDDGSKVKTLEENISSK